MKRLSRLLAILAAMAPMAAFGQGAVLQGGSVTPGHAPMYVSGGSQSQTIVQDSGPASGGVQGLGLSELLMTKRGTGTPPYSGGGTGPLGTTHCMYDAPTNNSTGYHYLCLDPYAQGGGLLAYGAGGVASQLPFSFIINGVTYTFPLSAAGFSFTQSGTGAVSVTGDQLYRTVIVTPEMYGDGTPCSTASSAGIQKAINYVASINGGRVQLSNCRYHTGPLTISTNAVSLEGYSGGVNAGTQIQFTPTAQGQCALSIGAGASIVSDVSVKNLQIVTTDTTTYKKGLCISDGSVTTIEDVFISTFTGGVTTAITNAVASPSNEIRLTVPNASVSYSDGWAVAVSSVAGTVQANSGWPILVVDGTHIDLKGSEFGATFVATGSGTNLTVASITTGTIRIGDTITGTGVPASTTITSQTSGTSGGAGVYVTSGATTSVGAAIASNVYVSGGFITTSSTGLRLYGRELYQVKNLAVTGDLPMQISPNPNNSSNALDSSNFNNLSLGSALGTNCILMVDPGVALTGVKFTGTQSWGGGKDGFCWRDNSAIAISETLVFDNVKQEQKAVAGGTHFNIRPNNTLYGLRISSPEFTDRNGVFARNVANLQLDAPYWIAGSGVCVDLDSSVQNFQINGGHWLTGTSTANLYGLTQLMASAKNPSAGCLPTFAVYSSSSATANQFGPSTFNGVTTTIGAANFGLTGSVNASQVWYGLTSGSATINAQNVMGTPTLTLPSGSGTFAVSASSPLVLSATTGALTCPTCLATTSLGTGVATALAVNVGSAGAFTTFNGAGGTPSSVTLTNGTGLPISTGLTGAGTGVLTALGVNVGTAGAFVVNGGALGSPSSAGTIPAFTLGGTIAGGGNQINNVIIGTTTPLAGAFTTLSATGAITGGTSITAGTNSVKGTTVANGPSSGTAGGSFFVSQLAGVNNIGMGNVSSLVTGGSYDGTPAIYGASAIGFYISGTTVSATVTGVTASTSSTTGSVVVTSTGGLGVGGAVWAGTYVNITPTVVNSLPSCTSGLDGARAFVTNNNTAISFAGAVTTGGATHSPVYCDGPSTSWKQGANDNIPASIVRKYA